MTYGNSCGYVTHRRVRAGRARWGGVAATLAACPALHGFWPSPLAGAVPGGRGLDLALRCCLGLLPAAVVDGLPWPAHSGQRSGRAKLCLRLCS